jgi:hypothetical protein
MRFTFAVLVIGVAGAAAGYFGSFILGLEGTAASLNVFISGPIAIIVGVGVGILGSLTSGLALDTSRSSRYPLS